jgi:hypothetical protein
MNFCFLYDNKVIINQAMLFSPTGFSFEQAKIMTEKNGRNFLKKNFNKKVVFILCK